MTPATVWTVLRWPLAIVGLLALASYAYPRFIETLPTMVEFDASGSILAPEASETASESALADPVPTPAAPATLATPTGPVIDGSATPLADLHVTREAAVVDASRLVLTDDPDDSITVAFPLPPGNPDCFATMTLTMTAAEVSSPTQVSLFPSTLVEAPGLVNDQQVEGDLAASPQAMQTALVDQPGPVALDLLAAYPDYFDLGQPPGAPLVMTMVPAVPVDSQGGVAFVASETGPEQAPLLSWTGVPDCS